MQHLDTFYTPDMAVRMEARTLCSPYMVHTQDLTADQDTMDVSS